MEQFKPARDGQSPFDCLLFDLDDTLYSSGTGMAAIVRKNIEGFLVQKCGCPVEKASDLRKELFRTYGSSLAGLRSLGYDIDPDEYHSFVHGPLPYEAINPDFRLRKVLQSITQRKLVFTNSDRVHAGKVLKRLGLDDCFDRIICFETLNPNISASTRPDEFPVILKPSMEAMRIAVDVAKAEPRRTLFFDDNDRNIATGKALGLCTVLIGRSVRSKEADFAVESILDLGQAIPEIWAGDENQNDPFANQIVRTKAESAPFQQLRSRPSRPSFSR